MGASCAHSYMAGAVRLVVFDFDQTLSVIHVFKTLAGWGEKSKDRGAVRIPRPFASSEWGQVRRISELSRIEPFCGEGFARAAFGGERRIEELRRFLAALAVSGVELVICTKGLVGAVRKCLADLRLLDIFSAVYGNVGSETYGETNYDKDIAKAQPSPEEEQYLGNAASAGWRTKADLISRLLAQRSLRKEQAVLVEDDAEEIRRAAPVCRTHWVREAQGMTIADFTVLRRLADLPEGARSGGSSAANSAASSPHGGFPALRPDVGGQGPKSRCGSPMAAMGPIGAFPLLRPDGVAQGGCGGRSKPPGAHSRRSNSALGAPLVDKLVERSSLAVHYPLQVAGGEALLPAGGRSSAPPQDPRVGGRSCSLPSRGQQLRRLPPRAKNRDGAIGQAHVTPAVLTGSRGGL